MERNESHQNDHRNCGECGSSLCRIRPHHERAGCSPIHQDQHDVKPGRGSSSLDRIALQDRPVYPDNPMKRSYIRVLPVGIRRSGGLALPAGKSQGEQRPDAGLNHFPSPGKIQSRLRWNRPERVKNISKFGAPFRRVYHRPRIGPGPLARNNIYRFTKELISVQSNHHAKPSTRQLDLGLKFLTEALTSRLRSTTALSHQSGKVIGSPLVHSCYGSSASPNPMVCAFFLD
jgi:hypothetical protein